jgi:hypothetical protein
MDTRKEVEKKIREEVLFVLSAVANMDIGKIIALRRRKDEKTAENLFLKDDLFLTDDLIQALAIVYTKRLKKYGGHTVTHVDTQNARTVGDVIRLLWSKLPYFPDEISQVDHYDAASQADLCCNR